MGGSRRLVVNLGARRMEKGDNELASGFIYPSFVPVDTDHGENSSKS